MYFIVVSICSFILSLCKNKNLSLFFSLLMPLILLNVYFQGEDWVNYIEYFNSENIFSSPEIIFNSIFFLLSFIFNGNYTYSLLALYLIVFIALYNLFHNEKHVFCIHIQGRYLLFLSLLILSLGPTLLLEQLRQLVALVFILYAISENFNQRKVKFIVFILLSLFSHVSAIVMFVLIVLSSVDISKRVFIFYVIFLLFVFYFAIVIPSSILSNVPIIGFVYSKIDRYLGVSVVGIGIKHLVYFIFAAYYVFFYRESSRSKNIIFFARMSFAGAAMYLLSSLLPFTNRFSSYFIVMYILFFLMEMSSCTWPKMKVSSLILIALILLTGISYYRNPISPLPFAMLDNQLFDALYLNIPLEDKSEEIKNNLADKMVNYGYE